MKTLDLLFIGALGLTGVALVVSTKVNPSNGVATASVMPTPQATTTPTPSPSPTPTITPSPQPPPAQQTVTQGTITQGTIQTVAPHPPQETSQPVDNPEWVTEKLGASPEEINAQMTQVQPEYQPEPEARYVSEQYAPNKSERGSGRAKPSPVGSSMPQPGENPIAFIQRSGNEPVWDFGDDQNSYPSQWGLPDQTTDKGRYRDRCLVFDTVCHRIFGNQWIPAPGSTPINNPDPTRGPRQVKELARAFGGAIQAANEQGY